MRACLLITAALGLTCCVHPPQATPVASEPLAAVAAPAPAPAPASLWQPSGPLRTTPLHGGAAWLHAVTVAHAGATVELQFVLFDSGHHDLQVIDQPEDWSGGGKITACMRAAGAVAGVNGGFFSPNFEPLGLMIANGHATGSWQQNKLLTGAIIVHQGAPALRWNHEITQPDQFSTLLQAGPRLVDAGRPVAHLERAKHVARTFIATDGDQRWILGIARSTSLGELAEILATPNILPGFTIHRALNLDGGRSTALYYRTIDGHEATEPGWSTVRNYLGIVPR